MYLFLLLFFKFVVSAHGKNFIFIQYLSWMYHTFIECRKFCMKISRNNKQNDNIFTKNLICFYQLRNEGQFTFIQSRFQTEAGLQFCKFCSTIISYHS